MGYKSQSGFTLVEVLVAGFILFSVISTVTLIYSGATSTSRKAESTLLINSALMPAMNLIKREIQSAKNASAIEINGINKVAGVDITWAATLLGAKAAQPRIEGLARELVEQPKRYKLWDVKLQMRFGERSSEYEYNELSYQEIR